MKNQKFQFIVTLIVCMTFSSIVSVLATGSLFDSSEVVYDNSNTGLDENDVQGAIDKLYAAATDYSNVMTRLSKLEGYFKNDPKSLFDGHDLEIAKNETLNNNDAYVDFWRNGVNRAGVGVSGSTGNLSLIAKDTNGTFGNGNMDIKAANVNISGFLTSKNDYGTYSKISNCNDAIKPGVLYHTESGLTNCPSDRWLFVWTKALGDSGTKNLMQFAAPVNTKTNIIWARSSDMNGNFGSWQQIYPEVYAHGAATVNTTNTKGGTVSYTRSGNVVILSLYDVCPKVEAKGDTVLATGVPAAVTMETGVILNQSQGNSNKGYRIAVKSDGKVYWWWTYGGSDCTQSSGQLIYVTS
ncbi:MAG: hypothetical protein K6G37_02850 [Bacilli bacterium]|nr:hypothetical protein [Bacilli bacterium]